jgi:hypothetical protein
MTITELDTLRADAMRAMLTEEGREHVWQYDICPTRSAFREALERQDYDDIKTDGEALQQGTPYCLIGPGICDHPFSTPAELLMLIFWLCADGGYLSCYARDRWQWQPHLDADRKAVADVWTTEATDGR